MCLDGVNKSRDSPLLTNLFWDALESFESENQDADARETTVIKSLTFRGEEIDLNEGAYAAPKEPKDSLPQRARNISTDCADRASNRTIERFRADTRRVVSVSYMREL